MLEIRMLRENVDAVAERLAVKGFELDIESFRALEAKRSELQKETEDLQAERNSKSPPPQLEHRQQIS